MIEVPESVRAWAVQQDGRADIDFGEEQHGWWVRARPRAAAAAGFTLGVSDRGEYDLFLDDGFAHEGWPWPEGAEPAELCRAIAAGRVRITVESWRGWELRREVVIDCAPAPWSDLTLGFLDLVVPRRARTASVRTARPY